MKMIKNRLVLLFCLFLLATTGCTLTKGDNNNPEPQVNQYLVSYVKKISAPIPVTVLDGLLNADPLFADNIIQDATQYSVNVYQLVYKTMYKGQEIQASGVCVIPDIQMELPVISYQHGTIILKSEAPSQFTSVADMSVELLLNLAMSSAGFICSVPDYIGYGVSADTVHPYHSATATARTCLDMLEAVKELCTELGIEHSSDYFLTGYSEGGYASLAMLKEMETNHTSNYNVQAVSAGAGAYDLIGTSRWSLGRPVLTVPAFTCLLFLAYYNINDLDRNLEEIFREPYAGLLKNGILSGDLSGGEVNSQLTYFTSELFTESFLVDFNGSGEDHLKNWLTENSLLSDWVPSAPIKLLHGTADITVPPFNSENAFQFFLNAGAQNLEYIPLTGMNHSFGILPWIKNTVQWFTALRTN